MLRKNLKRHLLHNHKGLAGYLFETILKHNKIKCHNINEQNLNSVIEKRTEKKEDESVTKEKKKCNYCGRFFHPNSITKHYRRFHSKDQKIYKQKCKYCNKKVKYLTRHIKVFHKMELDKYKFDLKLAKGKRSFEKSRKIKALLCIDDYLESLKPNVTNKNLNTIKKVLTDFTVYMEESGYSFSVIFDKNPDKIREFIHLIKNYFSTYTEGTREVYCLYLYNFVKQLITRFQQTPNVEFLFLLKIYCKDLRKKAKKAELDLDEKTIEIINEDLEKKVLPHLSKESKPLFTYKFTRYRLYGSLILRVCLLTAVKAWTLSNFLVNELLNAKRDKKTGLYNCIVKDHNNFQVIPLPKEMIDELKKLIKKQDSKYVFSQVETGKKLSVSDIDAIVSDYQRSLNVPSVLTIFQIRRHFTEIFFDLSDRLKLAMCDLLGDSYSSVVNCSRASYAAKELQDYFYKRYLNKTIQQNEPEESDVSFIYLFIFSLT